MSDGLVSSLFNRAILDFIVGLIFLAWADVIWWLFTSVDLLKWLAGSSAGSWTPFILLVSGFVAGTGVDRLAFQLLDRRLFWKAFAERRASMVLPDEVVRALERSATLAPPIRGTSRDAIDESRADVISAIFWVKARPEALSKRADLVANFQFNSNLLLDSVLFTPVVLFVVLRSDKGLPLAVLALALLIMLDLFLWRASVAAIGRIHTLENLYVLGLYLDGWGPATPTSRTRQAPAKGRTDSSGTPAASQAAQSRAQRPTGPAKASNAPDSPTDKS
ncbi:MAG: hypothetical protein U0Q19_10055 [Kineosporiaceae bacterium]